MQRLRLFTQLKLGILLVLALSRTDIFAQDFLASNPAPRPGTSQKQNARQSPGIVLDDLRASRMMYFRYYDEQIRKRLGPAPYNPRVKAESIPLPVLHPAGLTEKKAGSTYVIVKGAEGSKPEVTLTAVKVALAEMNISGRITTENGEALPGVTVALKGTTTGTITDADGRYTLAIPDGQERGALIISFIGYTSQEIAISGRTSIDVLLLPDVKALEEVVVIGYQTVSKRDLTGSVGVINPAAAQRVTANSVAESIQGLSPGVTVRNGGAPGQSAAIEIRGVASFINNNPLYVIDGMIADANPTINTNDIESIQVLKDASAAAIYGSRAGNGVIIITTKRGKEGPARVSAFAKYGIQQIPSRYEVMNSQEYAALKRTQYTNSGLTPPPSVGPGTFNPNIDTDWQDAVVRTGSMQDYNLSLSGGTATGNYLVSGSYYENKGILEGYSFNRGSFRVNTQSRKGRVTFGENLLLTNSNDQTPGRGNPFYDMPQMLPVIPVQGSTYVSATNPGGWGIGTNDAITYAWNPVAIRNLVSRDANFAKLVGNAYVDVEILKGLNYRFNAGSEVSFDHIKNLRKLGVYQYNAAPENSTINEDRSRFLSLLFEHTLNFNRTFGVHQVNGVLGTSQQHITREVTSGGRADLQVFNGEYLTTIGSAIGSMLSGGGMPEDYRIYGYLGRINYTLLDRYLLTLTGRVDQDSRFGEDYRTGFFPSVALGWRISSEGFFQVPWVSELKLNASYGELGINTLSSWQYIGFLNSNPRTIFGPDQTPFVGATQARLTNPDLRWENRVVKNIGLDASLLNNRLSLELSAYNSLSKDVLVTDLPVAMYLGNLGGNPAVNAASIRNQGFEFGATFRQNEGPFKWDVSANATTIKNEVESVGNRGEGIDYIQTGITRSQVGHAVAQWYVLKTNGLFQSQGEVDNYTKNGNKIQPFAKPGDIRFEDVNGDGQISQGDRTYVGSPWPKLQTGAQFNASYGPFGLNLQLVGVFGNTIFNGVRQILDSYQNTNFRADVSPWSPANMGSEDPRIGVATNDQGLVDNARFESDRWLESGTYVRLRNLELGFALPSASLSKAKIQNARIFVSGQNLVTLTKYSGLSPDVVGNGILERGFDAGNWPASRLFSIGLHGEF